MTQTTLIKNPRTEGKIKVDYGIADYYKYYNSNNKLTKITSQKYTKVVDSFYRQLIDIIIENNVEYFIPHIGVSLSIKKTKKTPRIVDGKLYNTTPVDWVATNRLWFEDEESKNKKLLVRYNNNHTSKHVFRIYMKKNVSPMFNKRYFSYKSSRGFQRSLSKRINDETKERYDSYLLY